MSLESTLSNLFLSLAVLLALSGLAFGISNWKYSVGVALCVLVSFGFDKLAKAKKLPEPAPMHLEPPVIPQRPLSQRIKMAGKRLSGQERNELLQEIDQLTRDIEEGDGWRHG